jgi:hypothetical protein
MHVVERFTRTDRDHIRYEATVEDPEVFSRPWKITVWLNRDMDPNATLGEFKCVEYSEELLYRDLNGANAR